MAALSVVLGIVFALALPGWGVLILIAYAAMCALETHRLKKCSQVNDWRWEHDLASLRRAAYAYDFRTGARASFQRPRRFYGLR